MVMTMDAIVDAIDFIARQYHMLVGEQVKIPAAWTFSNRALCGRKNLRRGATGNLSGQTHINSYHYGE